MGYKRNNIIYLLNGKIIVYIQYCKNDISVYLLNILVLLNIDGIAKYLYHNISTYRCNKNVQIIKIYVVCVCVCVCVYVCVCVCTRSTVVSHVVQ